MIYIVLISLFIMFYAVRAISVLKNAGFSLLSFLIDILILIALISFYYIAGKLEGRDLDNVLFFTHLGSYIYMYIAIKYFWIKPRLLIYLIQKNEEPENEELASKELDLQTSRIRSIYYFIISIVLLVITKLKMPDNLREDQLSMNPIFILIGIIIVLIWLAIDIYRKKKYDIFLFKTIVPLVVTIWIIIGTIILG
ncbi:DUF5080 family protein [Staphylococcus sp. SQ8-PEA]|uniref:DUF5080 family protein n=1 Tax=Staphylococcus marylandisciuri TaxID=2981529 RepID=A0ABT2QNV8_9STAP|nr:DUF5080 family protein [Staphylococcus marylandisciuri]MCU5745672.1 DUF5080 family protein [Staphylococcus marylandisciuri]